MKKVITLLLAALMLMLSTAFAETTSLEDMYNSFLNAVSSEYAYQLAYELSTNPAYMNSTTHGGRQAGSDAGQAVRKGQVLIRGQERTGGGGTRLCRAQGEIIARVFVRGDARVSLNAVETVETGEVRRRVTVESPWHSRIVADAQDFDSQDVSVERQAVVGLYLPVWRRVETLARTVHKQEKRLLADARSQAQGAAEKIAKLSCPAGAEILDKGVDYSMIDDEFVYATVVLAFEEEIGTRGMLKAQIEP